MMITTLTGSNSFLLKTKLDKLVNDFVDSQGDLALERIDGEESEYDRMREALESLPFLSSRKLVVLRAPSAKKEFVDKVENLLETLSETTDVIIHEPKIDKRSVYYKLLKKSTEYQEFNELDENDLIQWMGAQASINRADAKYLLDRVGANQQLLSNELAKLTAYNPEVTRQTIDLLTEPNPQSTVFQLLDAAFSGNAKRVLELYKEQRAQKVEPLAIIAMLAWQLHIFAVLKTAGNLPVNEIAKSAKLNPYVAQKSLGVARKLSLNTLKRLVSDLHKLDIRLKSASIDADDALQAYLLSI